MNLESIEIVNHPILGNVNLNFVNPKTGKPYSIIALVGENGCGKTTLLKELFDYQNSKYIVNKERSHSIFPKPIDVLFLMQNSLHRHAMKEVGKLINGETLYPTNSAEYENGSNHHSLRLNNAANKINDGLKLLNELGDKDICEIFKENHISEVYCSNDVSKLIDGKEHGYNIDNFSSGQQEILLKLKDLRNMAVGTDFVLLDEPETSLHPRWQKEIVNLIRLLLADENGNIPQIFLATHSEKVLESLIENEDALIVRLYKENNEIKNEAINELDLRLPSPTYAELDYIVFHISSFNYHNELFDRFLYLINKNTVVGGDGKIADIVKKLYREDFFKYEKARTYVVHGKPQTTNMLPTYIRDYFHHPNNIAKPTKEELDLSIELMRNIIKYLES